MRRALIALVALEAVWATIASGGCASFEASADGGPDDASTPEIVSTFPEVVSWSETM